MSVILFGQSWPYPGWRLDDLHAGSGWRWLQAIADQSQNREPHFLTDSELTLERVMMLVPIDSMKSRGIRPSLLGSGIQRGALRRKEHESFGRESNQYQMLKEWTSQERCKQERPLHLQQPPQPTAKIARSPSHSTSVTSHLHSHDNAPLDGDWGADGSDIDQTLMRRQPGRTVCGETDVLLRTYLLVGWAASIGLEKSNG